MKEQNYRNHRQLLASWHVITLFAILCLIVGSIRNLIYCNRQVQYSAALLVLVSFIILSLYYHTRKFALIAQDKAILADERLRYFILTGKRMDHRLTTSQIIALRFASDEEMPALADRAAEEKMDKNEIKKQIKLWREDWHRV